jgi:hypothetical protein
MRGFFLAQKLFSEFRPAQTSFCRYISTTPYLGVITLLEKENEMNKKNVIITAIGTTLVLGIAGGTVLTLNNEAPTEINEPAGNVSGEGGVINSGIPEIGQPDFIEGDPVNAPDALTTGTLSLTGIAGENIVSIPVPENVSTEAPVAITAPIVATPTETSVPVVSTPTVAPAPVTAPTDKATQAPATKAPTPAVKPVESGNIIDAVTDKGPIVVPTPAPTPIKNVDKAIASKYIGGGISACSIDSVIAGYATDCGLYFANGSTAIIAPVVTNGLSSTSTRLNTNGYWTCVLNGLTITKTAETASTCGVLVTALEVK